MNEITVCDYDDVILEKYTGIVYYKDPQYPIYNEKSWLLNGELHREGGPSRELVDGSRYWHINGQPHREDGPAIEFPDGGSVWFLNGIQLSPEEFLLKTPQRKKALFNSRNFYKLK